jgi:hypothetical protein
MALSTGHLPRICEFTGIDPGDVVAGPLVYGEMLTTLGSVSSHTMTSSLSTAVLRSEMTLAERGTGVFFIDDMRASVWLVDVEGTIYAALHKGVEGDIWLIKKFTFTNRQQALAFARECGICKQTTE